MKCRTIVIATMIFASVAAHAYTSRWTATLAQPVSKKKEVVAGFNAWRCDGSTCVLASNPKDADSVRTCRELRREVGDVTAYGVEGKQFDSAKLAACNAAH